MKNLTMKNGYLYLDNEKIEWLVSYTLSGNSDQKGTAKLTYTTFVATVPLAEHSQPYNAPPIQTVTIIDDKIYLDGEEVQCLNNYELSVEPGDGKFAHLTATVDVTTSQT